MWFMSIRSDIYVLFVWVLVLVDVFDEWVHDFLQCWLSKACYGENLGVISCEINCEYNFMVYLKLVKYLNCLFERILWFWCHGSLDDVVKTLWKLFINYWGFDVRDNILYDS